MADSGANSQQRQTQKKKKKKRKQRESSEESERPSKANRTSSIEQSFEGEGDGNLNHGGPWRNLQLILSIQKNDLELHKKVELAYDFLRSRVKGEGGSGYEDDQAVNMSRLVMFVSEWIQSLLISERKKVRSSGDEDAGEVIDTFLDFRCWEIFKFCMEESLKLNVSLSFSRNLLRSVCWISRSALSLLNKTTSSPRDVFSVGEGLQLYTTVLDCMSMVFSSQEGFSNENLDMWISTVRSVLDLGHKFYSEAPATGDEGQFVSRFLCLMLEPFSRFLMAHGGRKNAFQDFSENLVEPLLHLYGLLHIQTGVSSLGYTRNLLKLVEDVLSHGLYHPFHIDGFLSLCSTEKYVTSKYEKSKGSKTMNESYHRHLFDKVEGVLTAKNAFSVESIGVLFQLLIDQVKKLNRDSAVTASGKMMGENEGSRKLKDGSLTQAYMTSSESRTSETNYHSTSFNMETRRSLYYFLVLIMEPHLLEIDSFLEAKLKVGPEFSDVNSTLKSINSLLLVFMHEKIYVTTEDASEGACLIFLKKVYNLIISLSSDLIQLSVTDTDSFTLIANEILSSIGFLLEIEYDVLENDLVSLWLMMLSYLAIGFSLVDSLHRCSLFSKIIDIGCQLITLYSQLRQVDNAIFALCKAMRVINVHNRDADPKYGKFVNPLCGEAYAKSVGRLLCSQDLKIAIHKAMKSIPEGQASQCIRKLTLDISESLERMKACCSEVDGKGFADCHLISLHSSNLEAELFGRGLSEVYTLVLESLIVTTGNCNPLGTSIKELIQVISPCLSKLVGPRQKDAVNKFLWSVLVRDSDNVTTKKKKKCRKYGDSTYWVVLFFFRLYISCRCLNRQAAILMPPDLSRKMSAEMGDSFSSFSGRDWMEMSDLINEGFFSWIVQPSASLLDVIQSISTIFCKDSAIDSCPLTYVMHVMACERLVDLSSRIRSFEYLVENGDNLVHVAEISLLRQEAAGLTCFMMGHLSLVSEGQHRIFASAATTNTKMVICESDQWDFSISSVSKKSLPTAVWWVVCQNIHVWCPYASGKDLKRFLTVLIHTSLPYVRNNPGEVNELKYHDTDRLEKVALHQISSQCFIDSSLYEQKFVCRYFAKLFCRALEKSTVSFISDFPSRNVKFKASPNWSEVLSDLETSSLASSCNNLITVFDGSTASSCKGKKSQACSMIKFTACHNLLNLLSCMPKGFLDARSFSRYATYLLNLERIVVGGLLDYQNASYSTYCYELLRLFVSCRKALRGILVACEEALASQNSDTQVIFEALIPVLWLYKSVHMIAGLQQTLLNTIYPQVHDMILALMDHTFYVFLTIYKYEANRAVCFHEVVELNSEVSPEQRIPKPSNLNNSWMSVNVAANILKEQMQILLVNVKGGVYNGNNGVDVDALYLNKFSSIISCFNGFLWGLTCSVIDTDEKNSDQKAKLRLKPEPFSELNLCINVFEEISILLLQMFVVDDNKQSRTTSDAFNPQTAAYNSDLLSAQNNLPEGNILDTDMTSGGPPDESPVATECSASSTNGSVYRRSRLKDTNSVVSVLSAADSFELQDLNTPLLKSMLNGDFPNAVFLLRQLLIASSAVLRLNLQIKSTRMSSRLVHKFAAIMQLVLLESMDTSQVPHLNYFVCLDGALKYLEELGNHFPLTKPTLSRDLFAKMVQLQLWGLGRCITLQGKRATLASHETSKNIHLKPSVFSKASTLSGWEYILDDCKARLRSSLAVFIKKSTELHLQSAVQAIERALVGVQEGCTVRYDICTGSEDGGNVSSIVAAGIDCLDLVLEFVSGNNLSVIRKNIQGLIASIFNIILHLKNPLIFYERSTVSRDGREPNPGTVILMCVDVLARISGKHATYKMSLCHVAHSLRIPSALFQDFNILKHSRRHAPSDSPTSPDSPANVHVDRQYSIGIYSACCRLLHNIVKHHKGACEGYVALLQASVHVLLYCLETLDAVVVGKEGLFSWEVEEGVKCACSLRRIYEELRQQKEVFGPHCYHFLAYYIRVYSGYGPCKTGIKREIDEALRPGVYALIDVCSPDDLQRLHTSFGEGPCRSTLATLKHDYELNFQYQGKV